MDMSMPGIGGLEATRKIAVPQLMSKSSCLPSIQKTLYRESHAGRCCGLPQQRRGSAGVVSAIRSVYSGQRYIASDIANKWR